MRTCQPREGFIIRSLHLIIDLLYIYQQALIVDLACIPIDDKERAASINTSSSAPGNNNLREGG